MKIEIDKKFFGVKIRENEIKMKKFLTKTKRFFAQKNLKKLIFCYISCFAILALSQIRTTDLIDRQNSKYILNLAKIAALQFSAD